MFEEYIAEMWICPKCGIAKKVRVVENTIRNFERSSIDIFDFSGVMHSEMKVYCFGCGSECYRG